MSKTKLRTDTHQQCSTCRSMEPYENFYRDKTTKTGYSSYCKSCQRNYDKAYQQTDKYRRKVRRMQWKKQGIDISHDVYEEMFAAVGGACEICGTVKNQFDKGMCVDHDHATGVVRGILCTKCNMAIGNLNDDLELVMRAADYLRRYQMKVVV